jgi:FAD/FMN-containing dehydrogenase
MSSLGVADVTEAVRKLDPAAVDALRPNLRGEAILPGQAGYDDARTVWNAMIDRRPALALRCMGAADIIRSIRFAREHDLALAVRGGGHNIAGNAVCDAGVVIDLSPMRSVWVDAMNGRARVGPGATLGDFDREAQAFGWATPLGIKSTTGVAGLTLGGGFGWLSRKYGLTVDNLLSTDMVTADGDLLRASESDNADLFWALRGGGGNFGVVTSFEFRLHRVGPDLLSGLIVFPFEQASDVLKGYRDFVAQAPDELSVWAVLRKAPPLPFLPADVHGREVLVLALLYAGIPEEGRRLIEPLRRLGTAAGEAVGVQPFVAWQSAFDPLLRPGARNYWKSHDFADLADPAIEQIVRYAGELPSPQCEIFVASLGGAINRLPAEATAYPHRDAEFILNVHARWEDPEEDEPCIAWARRFFADTAPHATGGVYVNFMTQDEQARIRDAYGGNYARLAELKRRYDPANVFRVNQNIAPA